MLKTALLKQKFTTTIAQNKNDILNLNLIDKKKKFTFGGKLIRVFWKTQYTKFDIAEYVKVSKKQRTNISEKKVKDVLQYSFLGYCFDFKIDKTSINTSFSVRNVLDGFAVEMIFPIYSPVILNLGVNRKLQSPSSTRNKFYFLRKKPLPMSTVNFNYVTGKKQEYKKIKRKTIRKLK